MNKTLFVQWWNWLIAPALSWEQVKQEADKSYLRDFFYPLVGLASLAAFFHPFLENDLPFRVQLSEGIQLFLVAFASAFGGMFLAARLLSKLFYSRYGQSMDDRKSEMLAVYAASPILAVNILTRLVQELFFFKILYLYTFVIVWEASTHFYAIDRKNQTSFTLLAGGLIILAPLLLEGLLKNLLPGLN
jgi:hypothetical protein